MTDDIFDYFSGNSNRKVEPIDDDDNQGESNEPVPSDARGDIDFIEPDNRATPRTETESDEGSGPVADEVEEKVSHWDRLLGKLGITPAAKKAAPPKSVELPSLSAEAKAARALKRKEQAKVRDQEEVQPFGGIAAPAGSKPSVQPNASPVRETTRAENVSRASKEPTQSHFTNKDKPTVPPNKFGMGILDEIVTGEPKHAAPHGSETLADLFAASEKFEPPFEEIRREIDDLEPYPIDDLEPPTDRLDEAPVRTSELGDDYVGEAAEFIEYEVQDLDFSESAEERPRRPSRRDRARCSHGKPDSGAVGDQTGGRGRRGQTSDDTPKPPAPPRRGRNTRNQDEADLDFERDEPPIVEAESTPARGRRRSRGRGRGRGSRDSRPPRDAVDRVEIEDAEFAEPLEIDEHDEFDDHEPERDRGRGRNSRVSSRRPREENRVEDDDDLEGDPYGVYDDIEPEPARDSGRRRQSGDEDMELDSEKRPQIPTWSEAVASMVELNIKSRGSKPAGSGRGRGRPRRR